MDAAAYFTKAVQQKLTERIPDPGYVPLSAGAGTHMADLGYTTCTGTTIASSYTADAINNLLSSTS